MLLSRSFVFCLSGLLPRKEISVMEEPDSCQTILSVPDCSSKSNVSMEISPVDGLMMDGECSMISSTVDTLEIDDDQIVISEASSSLNISPLDKGIINGGSEELNTVIAIQEVDNKLELNQYIPVEVFDTANVIEIDSASGTTENPNLSEYGYLTLNLNKDDVPDMVASETVVTTSQPRRRKQNLESQHILSEVPVVESEQNIADSTDSAHWTLMVDGLYLDQQPSSSSSLALDTQHVVEVLTSDDTSSYVALAPDTTTVDLPTAMSSLDIPPVAMTTVDVSGIQKTLLNNVDKTTFEASIRALTKRQRDRLKKRELRMNPDFRLKEKGKSKERMRLRRQDPEYRELEREKDRIRRWQSRRRDDVCRQKERERDKHYKRVHRKIPKGVSGGSAAHVDVSSYNIDISDINNVDEF